MNGFPTPPTTRGSSPRSRLVVAGRELPNGDVAVMMVEAGGTPSAWTNFENGAPKIDEAALA